MRRCWLYGLVCAVFVSASSGYARAAGYSPPAGESKGTGGIVSTICRVFLAWLACTEIMMSQPPSTIVVVTTNTTPPAFLQELRGDDPKAIQRVAERALKLNPER